MATYKLTPLGDRILLRRIESEERSQGGIIIPDTAKEKPQEAEVVAVGDGRLLDSGERVPPPVDPGDRVLFARYAGNEIKLDGVEHLSVRSDDLLGVLERRRDE